MTDTMLERMARAMADAEALRMSGALYPTGPKLMEVRGDHYRAQARAALEAARELSDFVIYRTAEATEGFVPIADASLAGEVWSAGIDAILSEGQTNG